MNSDQTVWRVDGMDMKAAPGTLFTIGSLLGSPLRFLPQFAYLHLRSMSGGALTTSPGLRIGTNGAHNNIAPNFIPPTSVVVGQIGAMPLATPLIAPFLGNGDVFLELTQSAVGPTAMTADVLLCGILLG